MRQLKLLKYLIVKEYPKYSHSPGWNNVNFNAIPVIKIDIAYNYKFYHTVESFLKTPIFLSICLSDIVDENMNIKSSIRTYISFLIGREDKKEYVIQTNNYLNNFKGWHNIPIQLFTFSTIKIVDVDFKNIDLTTRFIIAICPFIGYEKDVSYITDTHTPYGVKWDNKLYRFYCGGIQSYDI
jgi:hypothetical protein